MDTPTQVKKENPLVSILANIVLPVVILNKSHLFPTEHNSVIALVVALAIPVTYGAWDFFKNSRKNYIALFGVVNILFTGTFALLTLSGIWFAVKEALFPIVIGIFVYSSSYFKKPLLRTMLEFSQLLKFETLYEAAKEKSSAKRLDDIFRNCNTLFSYSFFISAVLNFFLALYIFKPLPEVLSKAEQALVLNKQISQMTWLGFVAIGLPMTVITLLILFKLFNSLDKATGLNKDDYLIL